MSSFQRALWVLAQPQETFRSIADKPAWLAPLVILLGLSIATTSLTIPKVDFGEMMRTQMEASGQSMSDDQLAGMEAVGDRLKWPLMLGATLVFQPLGFAFVALVFFLIFKGAGSEVGYGGSLSVVLHSSMPNAISALLTMPLVLRRDTVYFSELQSGGILPSNLGFLVDDAQSGLASLMGSLDLFALWTVALLSIGFATVGKVSLKKAALLVVAVWLVRVLFTAGLAAIF